MIPIRVMGRSNFRPYATFYLIVFNVIFFIIELVMISQTDMRVFKEWTFNPCLIGTTPFTELALDNLRSMFMHGSWTHLLGNMMFLWIFGQRVEEYLGHWRFALFFVVAGTGAHLAYALFSSATACTPVVGASGAISGVMAALWLLYPGARVKTTVIFLLRTYKIPVLWFIGYWFVMQLFYGILSLGPAGAANFGSVAYWGHIGGFVTGMIIVFVVMMFRPAPKVDPVSEITSDD